MNPIPAIQMLSGRGSGKAFLVMGVLVALALAVQRKPLNATNSAKN
jgi:hypothetical protein